VVAGRRFVEVERLDPRRGARRQVVGVVIEDARPGAVRRAAIVGAAGVGLLAIGGHGPDLELGFRHGREKLADAQVHPLADRLILLAQPVLGLRLELRRRADVVEELGKAALEADLVLDRLHLAPDPRDFAQAQIVDIVRIERQRRVLLDEMAVELRPAFHVDEPLAVA
jgi:hypothetical protein